MNRFLDDPARVPVVVAAVRTPVGRHGGMLKDVRPDDLAALVIRAAVERAGIQPATVEEVILGCANQAGEDNRNIARMATLLAGVPETVPAITVNRLCASGLSAIVDAARMIRCGDADIVVAGGVESMSRAPYVLPKHTGNATPFGNLTAYDTALGWRFPNPRLAELFPLEAMGETAENLVNQYGISRGDQDAFALESHRRAVAAWDAGLFDDEIVPVAIPRRSGVEMVNRDEGPRRDTSLEKLAALAPAFRRDGSVTAGNSSPLNDGAAALVLMSADAAADAGLRPMARFVASAAAGVHPRTMGIGPVPATRRALARAGLQLSDLGLIELNEAFASQSLAVIRELGLDPLRVNPQGGAIALGHPLGCSGARITTTLLHRMRREGVRHGLAAMCVGVGQGVAAIFERIDA